jgi:hypothetical protein
MLGRSIYKMTTLIIIALIVFLIWFFWPIPTDEFTHKGMTYGVPIYLGESYDGFPTIVGRTKGFDLMLEWGWMQVCQFIESTVFGSDGFRVEITGEIKKGRPK